MIENLRGACPPHKKKDLDKLFKEMHGDEAKIMEKIQEWWEEPAPPSVQESWEAVNKKVVKRKPAGDRRDRGRGGGRDGGRGGGRGGRGGGRERNGKREERERNTDKKTPKTADAGGNPSTSPAAKNEEQAAAVPEPVPASSSGWDSRSGERPRSERSMGSPRGCFGATHGNGGFRL